jgi:hypothetical protein
VPTAAESVKRDVPTAEVRYFGGHFALDEHADAIAESIIETFSREQKPYGARSIRFAKETAMKVVKAAAVQPSPVLCSREGTVDKVVRGCITIY